MPISLWRDWSFEPGVIFPIIVGAVWYARGRRALVAKRRVPRPDGARAAYYWLATATLVLALASPLDAAADQIFSAHMIQHLLLIMVAGPLFALAAPAPELWWGLPRRLRLSVARTWRRAGGLRAAWTILTGPAVVFLLHAAAVWFWHFPAPYEAAEHNDALHALEHLSFLGTAVLFWWLVFQPSGHRRLSYPAAVLFIVATMLHSGALGGLLMYAPRPWYPSHAAGAALWGLTGLEDQQLAGLIMWIPAGFVYITSAVWVAHRWLVTDEREMVAREQLAMAARLGTVAIIVIVGLGACTKASGSTLDRYVEGGDPVRGARTIEKYGCGSCHLIPGINQANGMVGPPLIHWSRRTMIAGEIPNEPTQLITWITMPQAVEPGTAMPNMSVSDGEARDMAAYLYTLK